METINFFKYHDTGDDILMQKQHTHNRNIEILHVLKGKGHIIIDDKLYPLTDNSIFFIQPMFLHFSVPQNSKKYTRSVVNISKSYLNELCKISGFTEIAQTLFKKVCIVLDKSSSDYTDREFKKFLSSKKSDHSMAILNIFSKISETKTEQTFPENHISEIMSYINANLSEKITLDSICDKYHISKYYLCHFFKKTTNMSIMNYILNQRISMAKNLMIHSDKSISEIAVESGFSTFSYFSRTFKKIEDISPRDFRNKYINLKRAE